MLSRALDCSTVVVFSDFCLILTQHRERRLLAQKDIRRAVLALGGVFFLVVVLLGKVLESVFV